MSTDQGVRPGGDCYGSPWLPGAGMGAPDGGVHSAAAFPYRRSSCESSCSSSPWCSDVCVCVCVCVGGVLVCGVCVHMWRLHVCVCVVWVILLSSQGKRPADPEFVTNQQLRSMCDNILHLVTTTIDIMEPVSWRFTVSQRRHYLSDFQEKAQNYQTEMWKYKQHEKWLMLTLKIRNHLYVI